MPDPSRQYFVGIGAQKAGTTWLHDQLVRHPEVALPRRKEIHYFDMVTRDRTGANFGTFFIKMARQAADRGDTSRLLDLLDVIALNFQDPSAYRRYLEGSVTDQTQVVGEITPSYACLTEEGFTMMRELLDPKVVYVMRDPLSRYWSAVRMAARDDERLLAVYENSINQPGAWARSDYRTTVELVDRVFAPDKVLYLFYEDLVSKASLGRIASFLGISEEWDFDLEHTARVGRSRPMPPPPRSLHDRLRPVYDYVSERFGDAVPERWHLPDPV